MRQRKIWSGKKAAIFYSKRSCAREGGAIETRRAIDARGGGRVQEQSQVVENLGQIWSSLYSGWVGIVIIVAIIIVELDVQQ